MSAPSDTFRRLQAADTVPADTGKPEAAWSATEILEHVEQLAARGDKLQRPVPIPARRRPGLRLAVGVAMAVLIPVLAIAVVLSRTTDDRSVATSPNPTPEPPAPTAVVPIETDASNVPFYVRLDGDQVFHDDNWAVIVFYRSPNCIPPNANLLAPDPAVVGDCGPPTVDGVATWENGPDIDAAPVETVFTGRGEVPVWLVPWPRLEVAVADGELTRRDLLSMQTRVEATASTFEERIGPGGSQLTGEGELSGGEPFSFSVSTDGTVTSVAFAYEPATAESLIGAWEDEGSRFEFAADGTFTIIENDPRENFGIAPPEDAEFVIQGTFVVESGVVSLTETTQVLCPNSGETGDYSALIREDGVLFLSTITDICGVVPPRPLAEPLTRVE